MTDIALDARTTTNVLRRVIPTLAFTQMTAWGTTYYLPAIFRQHFATELGLSAPVIFSGVAVMLMVSALIAWPAGRLMDRHGAGRLMPLGSAFLALGLMLLAVSVDQTTYLAAWVAFGFGMALCMGNASHAALAQIAGQGARRAIVLLMLFGGMASTVFWPLTLWLESRLGWRGTCLLYAAVHLCACLPLYALVLAAGTRREARRDLVADIHEGRIPPARRALAAGLITIAFACSGFVSWGLDLHLIAILGDFGLGAATAVSVAAIKGPATLLARGSDVVAGPRISPLGSAMVAILATALSLALVLMSSTGLGAAITFIALYSFGTGLMAVARATLPLVLLGSKGYATTMGKLALPTQTVYAVAPMVFGALLDHLGSRGVISIGLIGSCLALTALLALNRLALQPQQA
jgi:MFS family permease